MDDHELLQEFAAHRTEPAFAELVQRQLPFVYATARRLVHDATTAEDVVQTVFIALAQKAWLVRPGTLPGWLYRATQRAAYMAVRTENRRRQRETIAMNLAEQNRDAPVAWTTLAPILDEALQQLNRVEQDALLLRYFDGRSLGETGRLLSLSEPAAQKRVSRALEKLRAYFARQGVTASAALLATTLGAHAAAAPPAGLAGRITAAALASAASPASGLGILYYLMRFLSMNPTLKTALAIAAPSALVVVAATGASWLAHPAPQSSTSMATLQAPGTPKTATSIQTGAASAKSPMPSGASAMTPAAARGGGQPK